jgi:hypothetical protein
VLSKHNIKMVDLLPRKLSSFVWTIKDSLALKTSGVYSIPCKCGYCKLDKLDIQLRQRLRNIPSKKSAVVGNSINLGHQIQL